METFGMVRIIMVGLIGFTLGAGVVGYYADRAIRALHGELNHIRRVSNDGLRTKARV